MAVRVAKSAFDSQRKGARRARGKASRLAARFQKDFGVGLINDEIPSDELHRFLPDEDLEQAIDFSNTATQLITGSRVIFAAFATRI